MSAEVSVAALATEVAAAEDREQALITLLGRIRSSYAEREALRERQEQVLRREAERDEEEIERLRSASLEKLEGSALLARTGERSEHAIRELKELIYVMLHH